MADQNENLAKPVADLELSVRLANILTALGIKTVGDLTKLSEVDLIGAKNMNRAVLVEIKTTLRDLGLSLAPSQ